MITNEKILLVKSNYGQKKNDKQENSRHEKLRYDLQSNLECL